MNKFFDNAEKLEEARKHYEKALQLDPRYAPALAGLSSIESSIYRNIRSDPEHSQRAEKFARQALQIDPQLARAHMSMGYVYGIQFNYKQAATELRKAVEIEADSSLTWMQRMGSWLPAAT